MQERKLRVVKILKWSLHSLTFSSIQLTFTDILWLFKNIRSTQTTRLTVGLVNWYQLAPVQFEVIHFSKLSFQLETILSHFCFIFDGLWASSSPQFHDYRPCPQIVRTWRFQSQFLCLFSFLFFPLFLFRSISSCFVWFLLWFDIFHFATQLH